MTLDDDELEIVERALDYFRKESVNKDGEFNGYGAAQCLGQFALCRLTRVINKFQDYRRDRENGDAA